MVHKETDFKRRVLDRFDDLPPQQKAIASYLLEHLREVPFLSVPELARRSGASEATVVRFAQRLGYDGWSGLRTGMLDAVRRKVTSPTPSSELFAKPPDHDALAAVARQEVGNIEESVRNLDQDTFRKVASAVFKSDHVYTYGMGISAHFAEILAYLLTQIGLRATPLSSKFSSPLEPLVALRPADLVFLFSFPPYSRQTLELAREVGNRGIPAVALCDRLTAPVASLVHHALPVRSDNMMYTNSFAAVSVLLNVLTTEIALRHHEHAAEAVTQINRVLERDAQVLGGE